MEHLAAWSEAVEQQRRVHAACSLEDDDWVLASMLDGYADAALDLGIEPEAQSSLREAEDLLADVLKRRPVFANELIDQVTVSRIRLEDAYPDKAR